MKRTRNWLALLLVLPTLAVMAALLIWPLWLLLLQSLKNADGYGIQHYIDMIREPHLLRAGLWTVGLSAGVAAFSTLVSLGPAWLMARYEFRGKSVVRTIFALPMSLSGVIVGFLTIIVLGRSGFLPNLAERLTGHAWFSGAAYNFFGLLVAYLYFEIPRATLTLESSLRKFDGRLEMAASSLGAGRWWRFRTIVWPLIRPALLSTFALTFSVSLGSFGVLLILATRNIDLLPLEIFTAYTTFPSDRGLAAAMAFVLLLIAFGVNIVMRRTAATGNR